MMRQLSLFLENKPGRLASIAEELFKGEIDIRAISLADAGQFGVVRFIVDDPDRAFDLLKRAGFTVTVSDVLGVEIEDKPGGFFQIARALGESGINIMDTYGYAIAGEKMLIVLRVDDMEKALSVLKKRGIKSTV
jgi:hypothetical protein